MPYDNTFTLSDGAITITWRVRPKEMGVDYGLRVAEHEIPGAAHHVIQILGHNSTKFRFPFKLTDINLITMAGAALVRPQDILGRLRIWARAGTSLTFVSDYVTQEIGMGSGMTVLITALNAKEIPVGDGQGAALTDYVANYEVEMELTRYVS